GSGPAVEKSWRRGGDKMPGPVGCAAGAPPSRVTLNVLAAPAVSAAKVAAYVPGVTVSLTSVKVPALPPDNARMNWEFVKPTTGFPAASLTAIVTRSESPTVLVGFVNVPIEFVALIPPPLPFIAA